MRGLRLPFAPSAADTGSTWDEVSQLMMKGEKERQRADTEKGGQETETKQGGGEQKGAEKQGGQKK